MILNFADRESELRALEGWVHSPKFEFLVMFGRRRVGKTYLLKRLLERQGGLYFLCDRGGTERNAARFREDVAALLGEPPIASHDFAVILRNLAKKHRNSLVVVIDEFSYLVEKDDAVPSIFQRIVDEVLPDSRIKLILCGSSVGMMEREILGARSPLYGRSTGHLRIHPMDFQSIGLFFPRNTLAENMRFYAILGGVPHHLARFRDGTGALENVRREIFSRSGGLYEEVDFLLREEFREPDFYKAILSPIAKGKARLVDIANTVGIPAHDMPKYLRMLASLGLVRKDYQVTDRQQRKPRYRVADNFFSFWFTFCEPFKSDLEIEHLDRPMEVLRQDFDSFVGRRFEEVVREQFLPVLLEGRYRRLGPYWGEDAEIDAVAEGGRGEPTTFVEVKWGDRVDGISERARLMEKAESFPGKTITSRFIIVARRFREKGADCIDLDDMLRLFRERNPEARTSDTSQ